MPTVAPDPSLLPGGGGEQAFAPPLIELPRVTVRPRTVPPPLKTPRVTAPTRLPRFGWLLLLMPMATRGSPMSANPDRPGELAFDPPMKPPPARPRGGADPDEPMPDWLSNITRWRPFGTPVPRIPVDTRNPLPPPSRIIRDLPLPTIGRPDVRTDDVPIPGLTPLPGLRPSPSPYGDPGGQPFAFPDPSPTGGSQRRPAPSPTPIDLFSPAFPSPFVGPGTGVGTPPRVTSAPRDPVGTVTGGGSLLSPVAPLAPPFADRAAPQPDEQCSCEKPRPKQKKRKDRIECKRFVVTQLRRGQITSGVRRINCK